jgi:tRNA-splicing ligase RtcB
MIEIPGKHNTAKIFTGNVESSAISQIIEICNRPEYEGSKIRVMPDVHAGAGCTIGMTMTITDTICPNFVGVDIGCGMHTVQLAEKDIDLKKLDRIIKMNVPSGFDIRKKEHKFAQFSKLESLKCKHVANMERGMLSIGTLGGGELVASMLVNSQQ